MSETGSPERVEVCVYLLNEGVDVWRPTAAEVLGDGRYRLLPTNDYDPEDEEWEFKPGTVVRCNLKKLWGWAKPRLLAVAEAADP